MLGVEASPLVVSEPTFGIYLSMLCTTRCIMWMTLSVVFWSFGRATGKRQTSLNLARQPVLTRRSGTGVAQSHQLANHRHTLRLANADHNWLQTITGHFTGVAMDHRAVAHSRIRSSWQVNHQNARTTYTHRHMVTLGITKDHIARQSVGPSARCTPGGFEDSVDCPRSTRRRAAAQSEYTDCQDGKWPSLHTSL
jgi:hypothetical protein